MWLSQKTSRIQESPEPVARMGVVTIGGAPAAVAADGEKRQVAVLSPGGYQWRPAEGQSLLIIKDAGEGFSAVGAEQASSELAPGEIRILSGGASMTLKNNGVISVVGDVRIIGGLSLNGEPVTTAVV